MSDHIHAKIVLCGACGGTHKEVLLRPHTYIDGNVPLWTHWAMCPAHHEPILMRITENGAPVRNDPPLPAHVAVGLTWARGATPETRELAIKEFCALLKMPCPKNGKAFRRALLMAAVMGQVMLQE